MSYYDDYIAEGLCCQVCGAVIDLQEPGYPRTCEFCSGDTFKVNKTESMQLLNLRKTESNTY